MAPITIKDCVIFGNKGDGLSIKCGPGGQTKVELCGNVLSANSGEDVSIDGACATDVACHRDGEPTPGAGNRT